MVVNPARPAEGRGQDVLAQSGDGYHQIGLARMGDAPDTSVTDGNACVHGMDNLFVAGSALFPTSGHANPTFSIVCQSLRLAEHLITKLSRQRTPVTSNPTCGVDGANGREPGGSGS